MSHSRENLGWSPPRLTRSSSIEPPQIALVGAGPGDPGLLTVRALRLIEAADVVVHDRLVSAAVLELIPPQVRRIDVGKGRGCVRLPQGGIHQLLIALAGAGQRVVRLKGGDPFIFGRGSEEADACAAAGYVCEVVPGISSALAAPAAAGVPLTERGVARSFAVVTAETAGDGARDQLRAAAAVDTVVLLMTARRLPEVARELIRLGRPPSEPAAAIERATQPGQRVVSARLDTIAETVRAHGLGAPMTVVLGQVAARAATTAFCEQAPDITAPPLDALTLPDPAQAPWAGPLSPPLSTKPSPEIPR